MRLRIVKETWPDGHVQWICRFRFDRDKIALVKKAGWRWFDGRKCWVTSHQKVLDNTKALLKERAEITAAPVPQADHFYWSGLD